MTFDDLLTSSDLPPPGPEFYAARRRLWLTPRPADQRATRPPSTVRRKLETLLSTPNAASDDHVWKSGIGAAWNKMVTGATLKQSLPMALAVKIVHAAWIRDETWPLGAVAPDSSDDDTPSNSPTVTSSPSQRSLLVLGQK